MKKVLLILWVIVISVASPAQSDKHPEIRITTTNALESKTLTTDFFGKYYFGKYIDSTSKWDAIAELKDKNRLGFFSISRAEVWLPSDNKFSGYFSGTHQSVLGLGFTKGLFQLVFTGNNSLVGQQVLMAPGMLHQYYFSGLTGGASFKINDQVRVFAGAGPVMLYSFTRLDFSESTFFTSLTADSLALDLNGSYLRAGGPTFIKGSGIGAEIGIEGNTGGFDWSIGFYNIGRVWLNRRTIQSERDTLMHFTGLEISDLANFSAIAEQELDDIEKGFSLKGDTTNASVSLPMMLTASCRKDFGKLRTDLGILYYHLPGFFPYTQLIPSWPVTSGFRVALPIKYGGYGSFNAGIGFEFLLADRITIALNAPSILTFINRNGNISYNVSGKIIYKITDHASLL